MTCPFYLVDAFAERALSGNPAGVCLLEHAAEEAWMQAVAAEVNQAETAFLWPLVEGEWSLRWFTPTTEVDLCGHATLASARVLPEGKALFRTKSGPLMTERRGDMVTMDFPAEEPIPGAVPLNLEGVLWTGRNRMDAFVVLESEMAVRSYKPNLEQIAQIEARGLCITAASDQPGIDFVSRFFAPQSGVPEDSVTGSTHCALSPFWSKRFGRHRLVGFQASNRGGRVETEYRGDRVTLGGMAWIVVTGQLDA